MDLRTWINKKLSEIQDTLDYSKYFDTIVLQAEADVYSLFNPELGIDLIFRPDQSIKAIHLYSENHGGSKIFNPSFPLI